ncbi:hypothetical protein CECT5772_04516 [Streptococcus equi subsp. ruminatorum CECT 5772]|uniref:Uncharacterized protein n=1 Tax=Streptococcus equi subsp. ruminatorum CECT 5772 TaxID=1051981 RepID=A0A922NUD1_9STRE|nr:hypothetical protein CECT5772_04516 [Streptococcus equi subsp. ruminatorum CECT 5772]
MLVIGYQNVTPAKTSWKPFLKMIWRITVDLKLIATKAELAFS